MDDNHGQPAGFYSFRITREDLGQLFLDIHGKKPEPVSPLFDVLKDYIRTGKEISPETRELAGNDKTALVSAIFAHPQLLIKNRMGGGTTGLAVTTAVHAPDVCEQSFAMMKMLAPDLFAFQLFDTPYHYLAWWLERNGCKAMEPCPNFMPPVLSFETSVYLLHCIDLFRRCIYQSMLDSKEPDFTNISMETFFSSLTSAIKAKDTRWLAPSFVGLIPGLTSFSNEKSSDILKIMNDLDFMIPVAGQDGGIATLTFGEAGIAMGDEFHQSWFHSAGFEFLLNTGDNSWGTLQRGYLAPTGLANHLFLSTLDDNDCLLINHQALTRKQLDNKMTHLVLESMKADSQQIAPSSFARKPAYKQEQKHELDTEVANKPGPEVKKERENIRQNEKIICQNCDAVLEGDQKFCTSCGQKEDGKPAGPKKNERPSCPDCGAEITENLIFCTECGERLHPLQ